MFVIVTNINMLKYKSYTVSQACLYCKIHMDENEYFTDQIKPRWQAQCKCVLFIKEMKEITVCINVLAQTVFV